MAAGIGIIENGKTNWHQLIIQNPTVRNGEVGFSGIRDSRPKFLNKSWIWVKIWRLSRPQFLVIFELSNSWAKNWPLPVWTFRFPVLLRVSLCHEIGPHNALGTSDWWCTNSKWVGDRVFQQSLWLAFLICVGEVRHLLVCGDGSKPLIIIFWGINTINQQFSGFFGHLRPLRVLRVLTQCDKHHLSHSQAIGDLGALPKSQTAAARRRFRSTSGMAGWGLLGNWSKWGFDRIWTNVVDLTSKNSEVYPMKKRESGCKRRQRVETAHKNANIAMFHSGK